MVTRDTTSTLENVTMNAAMDDKIPSIEMSSL